jgi:hypothetical protein
MGLSQRYPDKSIRSYPAMSEQKNALLIAGRFLIIARFVSFVIE